MDTYDLVIFLLAGSLLMVSWLGPKLGRNVARRMRMRKLHDQLPAVIYGYRLTSEWMSLNMLYRKLAKLNQGAVYPIEVHDVIDYFVAHGQIERGEEGLRLTPEGIYIETEGRKDALNKKVL